MKNCSECQHKLKFCYYLGISEVKKHYCEIDNEEVELNERECVEYIPWWSK